MGWKALKENFAIHHYVQVTDKGVCIGSGYVHNLVTINPVTGVCRESEVFNNFLRDNYPRLLEASPTEIAGLLRKSDTFDASIAVYTCDGAEIIEKRCEQPGWPNVTHDGCMMFDNTYSTDKTQVVAWAKRDAKLEVEYTRERITEAHNALALLKESLTKAEADQRKLEADYPSGHQVEEGSDHAVVQTLV